MAADVVAAAPLSFGCLTSRVRQCAFHFSKLFFRFCGVCEHERAFSAREYEPAINNRRPEKPLRDEDPDQSNSRVANPSLNPSARQPAIFVAAVEAAVCEHEEGKGERYPEPAYFDKVDIEDVALFGEVGGRVGRFVGLQDRVVGVFDADCGGEGAEGEGDGVD